VVWVVVFVGIGLAGAIMLICYAVWLSHKASDLWSELEMVAVRGDQLADLVNQIKFPERVFQPDWRPDRTISSEINHTSAT
jgi:hypothetical protein